VKFEEEPEKFIEEEIVLERQEPFESSSIRDATGPLFKSIQLFPEQYIKDVIDGNMQFKRRHEMVQKMFQQGRALATLEERLLQSK
jgi:hypothetical protein